MYMISLLSLAGLFPQLDASSRSYSCATIFYLAIQSSHHPALYLTLFLLSDMHTTYPIGYMAILASYFIMIDKDSHFAGKSDYE